LQVTWARIGGIRIGAPAAVLFVLWTGWLVGLRGGVAMAFLVGIVAWCSVYFYFAARVGMALAPVALYFGWRRSGRTGRRLGSLMIGTALGFAACMLLHHVTGPGQSIWPSYMGSRSGYVGSRGERDLYDWIASTVETVRGQTRLALRSYFWSDRLGPVGLRFPFESFRWRG